MTGGSGLAGAAAEGVGEGAQVDAGAGLGSFFAQVADGVLVVAETFLGGLAAAVFESRCVG